MIFKCNLNLIQYDRDCKYYKLDKSKQLLYKIIDIDNSSNEKKNRKNRKKKIIYL